MAVLPPGAAVRLRSRPARRVRSAAEPWVPRAVAERAQEPTTRNRPQLRSNPLRAQS